MTAAPSTVTVDTVLCTFRIGPAREPLPENRKGKGSGKRRWWLATGWEVAKRVRYLDLPGHHERDAGTACTFAVPLIPGSVVTLGCGDRTRIQLTVPADPSTIYVTPTDDGEGSVYTERATEGTIDGEPVALTLHGCGPDCGHPRCTGLMTYLTGEDRARRVWPDESLTFSDQF